MWKLEKKKKIVSIIRNKFKLVNLKQKTKQVAFLELKIETDQNKIIKKNWDKIINMIYNTKKMSNKYLKVYKKLNAPLEIVLDLSLDNN